MSALDTGSNGSNLSRGGVKTLAIRLEPDLHAQLSLIAQLRGSTITDEIRSALDVHITHARTAPELASKADGALEEIEREAIARREAIATLFGTGPLAADTGSSRSRSRKAADEGSPGADA